MNRDNKRVGSKMHNIKYNSPVVRTHNKIVCTKCGNTYIRGRKVASVNSIKAWIARGYEPTKCTWCLQKESFLASEKHLTLRLARGSSDADFNMLTPEAIESIEDMVTPEEYQQIRDRAGIGWLKIIKGGVR